MATTALQITNTEGVVTKTKFMTVDRDFYVDVDIYKCNDQFIPIGEPSMGVNERTEEVYHKELRQEAKKRGQYVPEESTNPEWDE